MTKDSGKQYNELKLTRTGFSITSTSQDKERFEKNAYKGFSKEKKILKFKDFFDFIFYFIFINILIFVTVSKILFLVKLINFF